MDGGEIYTPFLRRFCEKCKREFSPAKPQIRLCPNCGGPPEVFTSRQEYGTVRIYDLTEVIASEIICSPNGKIALIKSGEYPEEGPFDYHGVSIEWSLGVWDLDRFTRIRSICQSDMLHTMEKGLAITEDGRFALTGGRYEVVLWNLDSGKKEQEYKLNVTNHYLANAVNITPDNTQVIAGDNRGSVWLWDLSSGECLRKLDCDSNQITHMALLSNGNLITVAALGDLRIWRLSSGECLGVQHTGYDIPAAILTRDEQLLFSTRGGSILQWNPLAAGFVSGIERESTLYLVYQGEAGCATFLTLTADGSAILAGGNNGVLRLIELSTGKCLSAWRPPTEYAQYINCLALTPDGRRALVGAGDQLHLWEWKEPLGSGKEFIERQLQTTEKDEVEWLRQEILIASIISAHCRKCNKDLTGYANSDGRGAELQEVVTHLCPDCAVLEDKTGGKRFGEYLLLQQLGQSGFSRTYRSWHSLTCREVMLEEIDKRRVQHIYLKRYMQIAQALMKLSHPNLLRLIHTDEQSGILIWELFPGETADYFERAGSPQSYKDAIEIGIQTLSGLEYLHNQGWVHRNIQPHNLRVTKEADRVLVKIAGFNFLFNPQSNPEGEDILVAGIMRFISPEDTLHFKSFKQNGDLYSLGASLYYMLTGMHVMHPNHKFEPVPIRELNPEIPERLAQVIDKAVRIKPEERYQSAMDLKRDLLDAMGWGEQHPQGQLIPIQTLVERLPSGDTIPLTITCSIFKEDITSLADSDGRARELLGDVIYWCPRCLYEVSMCLPETHDDTPNIYFIKTTDNLNWLPSASRLAWQSTTGRVLVVKQVQFKPDAQDDLHNFVQNLETIRDIRHPNLTRLIEYQSSENTVWLSSAYVHSNNLWDEIISQHERPIEPILRSMTGLLNGLEMMHIYGYTHLNIHPWNVLIPTGEFQNPKLCLSDLLLPGARGLSQPTGNRYNPKGNINVLFLAPERIREFKKREPVSDIYALGHIFYFMLTAALPLDVNIDREMRLCKDPINLILDQKRISILDRRPDLPVELARVVDRVVDPIKENRYQSVTEFKRALVDLWKIL